MTNDLHERAARGARYRELLQSGELAEAFDHLEGQYTADWINTVSQEERDNLWRTVRVLRKVRAHIASLADDGKLATYQLQEMKRL